MKSTALSKIIFLLDHIYDLINIFNNYSDLGFYFLTGKEN